MGGEDARDEAIEIAVVGWDWEEAAAVEVERGGAPEVAPPGREDLGAGAVLGGEEGDDLAQDSVGDLADAVLGGPFAFAFSRSGLRPLVAGGSASRRRPLPLLPARTRSASARLHLHGRRSVWEEGSLVGGGNR